jgi:hypothetical protein
METQTNIVVNFSIEKETEKAAFVHIPYAYATKTLKMWITKSVLSKNSGIPTWIIKNHLNDFNAKSRNAKFDIEKVLNTAGKTSEDTPKPEASDIMVTVTDFVVDRDAIRELIKSGGSSEKLIIYLNSIDKHKVIYVPFYYPNTNVFDSKKSNYRRATVEEFQKQIHSITSQFNVEVPLVSFPKQVSAEKASEFIDITLLNGVKIRDCKKEPFANDTSWFSIKIN